MNIRPLPNDWDHLVWDFCMGPYGSQVVYDYLSGDYVHVNCVPESDRGRDYQEANPARYKFDEGYGVCRHCGNHIVQSKVSRFDTPNAPGEMNHFL